MTSADRVAEIIRSTASGGSGGVFLAAAAYPRVPAAILAGLVKRANAGKLDTVDEQNAENARTVSREVTVTKGRNSDTYPWRGFRFTGVDRDGNRATVQLLEPSLESGKRQIVRVYESSSFSGRGDSFALPVEWSNNNEKAMREYKAALADAREQAQANNAARAAADDAFESPDERAARLRQEAIDKQKAKARAAKIADRFRTGDSRDASAYQARIARISENSELTGLFARLIDEGRDVEQAAEDVVADVGDVGDVANVSALDRLYPLEDDAYYLDTFAALPLGWGELYLGLTGEADLPLEPDQYYIDTFRTIPQPWQNLYRQAMATI